MGVPLYPPQQPHEAINDNDEIHLVNKDSNDYYYYSHPPSLPFPPSPSSTPDNLTESSDMLSDYFSNGLTYVFVEKYQRELTIAASGLSVIILIIIGTCLWCLIGLVKRSHDKKIDIGNGDCVEDISGSSGAGGKKSGGGSNELDSSCSGASSAGSGMTTPRKVEMGSGSKKGISLISKIFSKQNGNSARILAQHRNIITPDKSIPFVVPTIQLPAQPAQASRNPPDSSRIFPDDRHHASSPTPLDPQPSTSKSPGSSKHQALLLAQQFFPQLENPESDSCPLVAFSLYYELSSQILNVRLLEGRNFPDTLVHTIAVKIYPGRGSKQHTKEFKNRSPVYNQEFCFHVRKSSLHTKILKLRAVIPGSPKRVIGYVNVGLKDLPGFDKELGVGDGEAEGEDKIVEDLKTTQLWRRVELPSEVGDGVKLQVSLQWSPEPSPGLLTLKIIEAAGLHENRDCDYTSSYVKVTLQEQGRSIKTRKTQLIRWGSVPRFDDVFVLTIPKQLLPQISFLLVVIARGRLGSKAVLGKICVGSVPYAVAASSGSITARGSITTTSSSSSASSSGIEFWEDMCHQPDSEIVRWLHLLP